MMGGSEPAAAPGGNPAANVPKAMVCNAQQGQGIQISASLLTRAPGQISLDLEFNNQTSAPVQNFAIQLNKNSFGLVPSNANVSFPAPIQPQQTSSFTVPMTVTPAMLAPGEPNTNLQVAVKNMHSGQVFYFTMPYNLFVIFKPSPLDTEAFKAKWAGINPAQTASCTVSPLPGNGNAQATGAACQAKLNFVHAKQALSTNTDGVQRVYYHCATMTNVLALVELSFKEGFNGCKLSVRSDQAQYAEVLKSTVEALLKA